MRLRTSSSYPPAAQEFSRVGTIDRLWPVATRCAVRLAEVPRLTVRLLGASALLAIVCVAFGWVALGAGHQHELFRDLGPASLVTSLIVLSTAALGLLIARSEGGHDWRDVNNFWFLSGLGFLYLSVDGPLDLHGKIGEGLAGLSGVSTLPGIHRTSDAVLVAYAALGLAVVGLHWREVIHCRTAAALLGAGAAATVLMLGIDASVTPTPWLVVIEESVELAGASFFLSAFAARYRTVASV